MFILHCEAILFDLDGTLIESTFYIERLWQDWGIKHGVTPQHMSEVMHGRRGVEIISIVAPHLTIQEEAYALETAEILEHFQWREEIIDKEELASELADVGLYLLELASVAEIDLEQAILKKLEINKTREWDQE